MRKLTFSELMLVGFALVFGAAILVAGWLILSAAPEDAGSDVLSAPDASLEPPAVGGKKLYPPGVDAGT